MKIELLNTKIVLRPDNEAEEEDALEFREATAYAQTGARFDPRFVMGQWDGKVRPVKKVGRRGGRPAWQGPVGLAGEALARFGRAKVVDRRRAPGPRVELVLDPSVVPSLRDYQREAVDAILEDRGVLTGKGMLRLPTRSGKTVVAAGFIAETGLRSLFIVNSDLLLRQTVLLFAAALKQPRPATLPDGVEHLIGQFGGGVLAPGWITVASVQCIVAHWGEATVMKELLGRSDAVFFDECHHFQADTWRKAMTKADAVYKIGLSATIADDGDSEARTEAVALSSVTGPVLYSLEASDLIEAGWLCQPRITFLTAAEVDVDEWGSFAQQYKQAITLNAGRNAQIVELCADHVERGERVLVTLRFLDHVATLKRLLEEAGLTVAKVVGATPAGKRAELIAEVRDGVKDVLIGTVFGEGVDLPWLDVVVVGDGFASDVLTAQRLRCLTPYDPETLASRRAPMNPARIVDVYDFADVSAKMLAKHSAARLAEYKRHRAFLVRWQR